MQEFVACREWKNIPKRGWKGPIPGILAGDTQPLSDGIEERDFGCMMLVHSAWLRGLPGT